MQRGDTAQIIYKPWDFKKVAKQKDAHILNRIKPTITACLDATGFFLCAPSSFAARIEPSKAVRKVSPHSLLISTHKRGVHHLHDYSSILSMSRPLLSNVSKMSGTEGSSLFELTRTWRFS